jgi:ligand-binding sensor domain-containing protein
MQIRWWWDQGRWCGCRRSENRGVSPKSTSTHFTEAHGVEGTEAWDLYEDRSGNIWFPIENSGVYRYDGKSFTRFHKNLVQIDGLTSNAIQCTYEGKEGRLWLGGYMGLFRFDGKSIMRVGKHGPWR